MKNMCEERIKGEKGKKKKGKKSAGLDPPTLGGVAGAGAGVGGAVLWTTIATDSLPAVVPVVTAVVYVHSVADVGVLVRIGVIPGLPVFTTTLSTFRGSATVILALESESFLRDTWRGRGRTPALVLCLAFTLAGLALWVNVLLRLANWAHPAFARNVDASLGLHDLHGGRDLIGFHIGVRLHGDVPSARQQMSAIVKEGAHLHHGAVNVELLKESCRG